MTLEKLVGNLILQVIDEAMPGRSTVHASSSAANGTSCVEDAPIGDGSTPRPRTQEFQIELPSTACSQSS